MAASKEYIKLLLEELAAFDVAAVEKEAFKTAKEKGYGEYPFVAGVLHAYIDNFSFRAKIALGKK